MKEKQEDNIPVDQEGIRLEYVDRFAEYFLDSLEDYNDIKIYKFTNIDLEWLNNLLDFGKDVFGEDSFDVFAIVTQVFYGSVFMLKEKGEDDILGIAALNRCWDDDIHMVYLADYAIAKKAQGLGLGSRFLRRILNNLKGQGVEFVRLTVDIENQPAINLYEKMGFAIIKEQRNLYGKGAHRYIMEIEL